MAGETEPKTCPARHPARRSGRHRVPFDWHLSAYIVSLNLQAQKFWAKMAEIIGKAPGKGVPSVTPAIDSVSDTTSKGDNKGPASNVGLTFARRGERVGESAANGGVDGFDSDRMRDRSLLTAEEEKALMRRIDWRIMSICSLLFLMKNLDSDNISNARIMNRETDRNIMTQLNMSSDQYNLLNVLYYVSGGLFLLGSS